MKKRTKILGLILTISLAFNALAIGASATIGDGNMLSADIDLEIGTMNSGVFTPLPAVYSLNAGDVITVRICPETDFYCGVSRYVVLFSRDFFEVETAGYSAFTPNTVNSFYAAVATGCAGMTGLPADPKGGLPAAEYLKVYGDTEGPVVQAEYSSIAVNNLANTNSANGGYPGIIPGDWLFRFNLVIKKDIKSDSNARIWMDSKWFRNPLLTNSTAYFAKCESSEQLSSTGNSTAYNFNIDMTDADITLNAEPAYIEITQAGKVVGDRYLKKLNWLANYRNQTIYFNTNTNVRDYQLKATSDNTQDIITDAVSERFIEVVSLVWWKSSANITVYLLDLNGNVLATDSVKVIFYKFPWQLKNL